MDYILKDILKEREHQIDLFGVSSHPDIPDWLENKPVKAAQEFEIPTSDRARFKCENAFDLHDGSYSHILIEEVSEVIEKACMGHTKDLRKELIQVATVAMAWIEDLDNQEKNRSCGGCNTDLLQNVEGDLCDRCATKDYNCRVVHTMSNGVSTGFSFIVTSGGVILSGFNVDEMVIYETMDRAHVEMIKFVRNLQKQ